ncbi:LCP family protein [Allostreptomyces psammosilenae]|uniref:LCP family protein required for cell wall assembly n=1 Tax=Allostreptomyces psammosilenae TaxID=1892865 RepID=A0A852ZUS1_9ACTN|nr:LCP family protein [Allostreptomyces psammosilenae]NYI06143.1 LCP family protein required for cell wall assembly [Allostreptomyces psammosilenae]
MARRGRTERPEAAATETTDDIPGGGRAAARRAARGGGRRRKKPTGARRFLRPVSIAVGITLVAGCAGGYLYLQRLNGNIDESDLYAGDYIPPEAAADAQGRTPLNILLIGTDSREGTGGQYGNMEITGWGHNDVNMLLHISADRTEAVAVNIPRDTVVDIPECTDGDTGEVYGAIRAAFNDSMGRGGPGCTVQTVAELTNIRIHHFLMVDFQGVKDLSTAVGGVTVNLCEPIRDEDSGLDLPAGEQRIAGEDALAFVRTRKSVQDGSDLGRFNLQRQFLSSLFRELTSAGTLLDPTKLLPIAEAATNSLTVSPELGSVTALMGLAQELGGISPDDVRFINPQMQDSDEIDGKVELVQPQATQMFDLIAADQPLDGGGEEGEPAGEASGSPEPSSGESPEPDASASAPAEGADGTEEAAEDGAAEDGAEADGGAIDTSSVDPATVSTVVLNGTLTGGKASEVAEHLGEHEFTATTGNAATQDVATSTVAHAPGEEAIGLAVAQAIGLGEDALEESADLAAGSVTVTIGADFPEEMPRPTPSALPEDVTVHDAAEDECTSGYTGVRDA